MKSCRKPCAHYLCALPGVLWAMVVIAPFPNEQLWEDMIMSHGSLRRPQTGFRSIKYSLVFVINFLCRWLKQIYLKDSVNFSFIREKENFRNYLISSGFCCCSCSEWIFGLLTRVGDRYKQAALIVWISSRLECFPKL